MRGSEDDMRVVSEWEEERSRLELERQAESQHPVGTEVYAIVGELHPLAEELSRILGVELCRMQSPMEGPSYHYPALALVRWGFAEAARRIRAGELDPTPPPGPSLHLQPNDAEPGYFDPACPGVTGQLLRVKGTAEEIQAVRGKLESAGFELELVEAR